MGYNRALIELRGEMPFIDMVLHLYYDVTSLLQTFIFRHTHHELELSY